MAKVVYASDGFPDQSVERRILLDQNPDLHIDFVPSHGVTSPASRSVLADADVLIVALENVTSELLDAMPRCRLISRLGVGVDAIDVDACTKHGVWVANVPDYGVDEVSTHAITLMLSLLRGIVTLSTDTRRSVWTSQPVRPIARLAGQTLGVLGFGRIGRLAASKARGLGMRILAYDPFLTAEVIRAEQAEPATIEQVLRNSDFITLHLPLGPETKHIINAGTLAQMKPTAQLINTARGGLVDEEALLNAVRSGQIRGAGLDVLSQEPPAPDHPILSQLAKEERIIITPHIAWYSEQAMIDMREKACDDIIRVLRGQRPRTPVNNL